MLGFHKLHVQLEPFEQRGKVLFRRLNSSRIILGFGSIQLAVPFRSELFLFLCGCFLRFPRLLGGKSIRSE